MKKTILTAIALLCLSTPLQARDCPCIVLDIPCYIKSSTTILRKEPSKDSPIVQQLSPARDSDRLYFYLRSRKKVKEGLWGYFEPVEPIVDLITGKTMAGGWTPLANAFHDLDENTGRLIFSEPERRMESWVFKPNELVFILNTPRADFYLPLRPENIAPK